MLQLNYKTNFLSLLNLSRRFRNLLHMLLRHSMSDGSRRENLPNRHAHRLSLCSDPDGLMDKIADNYSRGYILRAPAPKRPRRRPAHPSCGHGGAIDNHAIQRSGSW